jgi:hypothetical protein
MFFGFNENFSERLTFVRYAKVGELYATHSESAKISVLAEIGVYKTNRKGSFDIFCYASDITVIIASFVTHLCNKQLSMLPVTCSIAIRMQK